MPFPVDIEFLNRTEAKLGRKLPLDYVVNMCRANGGDVKTENDDWILHPILDDSDRKRRIRTSNDVIRETTSARKWSQFPPHALAIGTNGAGDVLLFLADSESDRYGDAVYWWDHETGDVNKVADTFEELMEDQE